MSCTHCCVLTQDRYRVASLSPTEANTLIVPEAPASDRRKRARIRLSWRVDLLISKEIGAVETTTRDLSSGGFYCWSPVPFVPGERMVAILKAPAHGRELPDRTLSIECLIRIARVEHPNQNGCYGVGCEIIDYKFPTA